MPVQPTSACAYDYTEACPLPGHSDSRGTKRLITISPPIKKSASSPHTSGLHGPQAINAFSFFKLITLTP